jgi:hypothetical protein
VKRFFFEKKNQKTFFGFTLKPLNPRSPDSKKFLPRFFQKSAALPG